MKFATSSETHFCCVLTAGAYGYLFSPNFRTFLQMGTVAWAGFRAIDQNGQRIVEERARRSAAARELGAEVSEDGS